MGKEKTRVGTTKGRKKQTNTYSRGSLGTAMPFPLLARSCVLHSRQVQMSDFWVFFNKFYFARNLTVFVLENRVHVVVPIDAESSLLYFAHQKAGNHGWNGRWILHQNWMQMQPTRSEPTNTIISYSLKNRSLEEKSVEEDDKRPDEFEEHLQRFGQFSEAVRGRRNGNDSAMGKWFFFSRIFENSYSILGSLTSISLGEVSK